MQKYELMLLLNPNTMDEVEDFISSLKKLISDNKGDLIDTKLCVYQITFIIRDKFLQTANKILDFIHSIWIQK